MPTSFSFLSSRNYKRGALSLRTLSVLPRSFIKKVAYLCFSAALSGTCHAYTTVQISTGAPAGTEGSFISSVLSQFNATYATNPFFPNTYAMTLYGPNPSYNPPASSASLLSALVAVSTYTYVYGFAGGMEYQNKVDEGVVSNFAVNCSTPSAFSLALTSTATFNAATCQDVLASVLNALYQLNLSTPTVVPGF